MTASAARVCGPDRGRQPTRVIRSAV